MGRKIGLSDLGSVRPIFGMGDERDNPLLEPAPVEPTREQVILRRRLTLAAAAVMILVTGLVVTYATVGFAGDLVGDALYAVLIFLIVSFIFVRMNSWRVAVIAILICTGIELFQLTGLPVEIAAVFPPARFVLGTAFDPVDLVAYIIGVLVAAGVTTWRRLD
ncbi:DUF2809 domain-containing protein [Cryobacterium sp. PAMC25264]|uniref:ribosomal maturation YjgA family protein n=1 Tax=Cryobacterium sp. PAMC25264 TaxID=2861288 RepID=UPI001C62E4B9|nr:DUF2809 domain-containing protein [Cryobacterium sp. PAMC25264]QYF72394.1 DUF2809 domain-containing protein [Cryobacterium sp. PAMC25264]